jgi:hypothetical protein
VSKKPESRLQKRIREALEKEFGGIGNGMLPTLDRIHNYLGYIRGNVEVISWRANHLKSDSTLDELRKMVRYYGKAARKSIAEKDKGGT